MTKTGFDLLQLMADNASDWHDSVAIDGLPGVRAIVMTALLDAQLNMLRGQGLAHSPIKAKVSFARWADSYDALFLQGCALGVVPSDQVKHSNLPPQ